MGIYLHPLLIPPTVEGRHVQFVLLQIKIWMKFKLFGHIYDVSNFPNHNNEFQVIQNK